MSGICFVKWENGLHHFSLIFLLHEPRVQQSHQVSGPGGQGLVSWVFSFGVTASIDHIIDRYHFVLTNAGLADGADLTLEPGFQPGSQAGPTEEVSTHG